MVLYKSYIRDDELKKKGKTFRFEDFDIEDSILITTLLYNYSHISFNTIQPYPEGELEGLYPTIRIEP